MMNLIISLMPIRLHVAHAYACTTAVALYPLFVYPYLPSWPRKLFLAKTRFVFCSVADARQFSFSRKIFRQLCEVEVLRFFFFTGILTEEEL